jgi:hypothetical protein
MFPMSQMSTRILSISSVIDRRISAKRRSASGVTYQLTPVDQAAASDGCRRFLLIATGAFGLSEGRTTACPGTDGVWDLPPEAKMTRR